MAVVLTGTANDQLTAFNLALQNLSLVDKSGATVNLLATSQGAEFMHINGGVEPLMTFTVPQGDYTSATAMVGFAQFTCVQLVPGIIDSSTFEYGQTPATNVTVNLPSPISVTGNTMTLSLIRERVASETYSSCYWPNGSGTYAITPTFTLAPATLATQPTSSANGKVTALNGQVSSVDATNGSIALALPFPENTRTLSVTTGPSTTFAGIDNFASIAPGTFVTIDGAIQSNSSVAATRVASLDVTATSAVTGPLFFVSNVDPALLIWGTQNQGALFVNIDLVGSQYFSFGSATFHISGEMHNLSELPFVPVFTAATMVPGQYVYLSTNSMQQSGGFPYTPLTTVTLIPQTLDGTITGISSSGNFTVYTISLASYDLFPMLAVQPGQATLLNNPAEVQVYADTSTQQLAVQPVAEGNTFRFTGMVFNDGGTLRMDCAEINDGVAQNPSTTPAQQSRMEGKRRRLDLRVAVRRTKWRGASLRCRSNRRSAGARTKIAFMLRLLIRGARPPQLAEPANESALCESPPDRASRNFRLARSQLHLKRENSRGSRRFAGSMKLNVRIPEIGWR